MIRIVTAARLARLSTEAEQARNRASQVQEQADAAFSAHLRSVAELTGRAEQDRAIHADVVTVLRAELDAAELREVVLLLHFGQPHSIHRSVHAAKACAGTHGADPAGWQPCSGLPSMSDAWATIAFTFDDATDAFMCSMAPSLPVSGGAG